MFQQLVAEHVDLGSKSINGSGGNPGEVGSTRARTDQNKERTQYDSSDGRETDVDIEKHGKHYCTKREDSSNDAAV